MNQFVIFEPTVETLPAAEQHRADDAAWRRQVTALFANSRFYRDKFAGAGFASPAAVGGLDDIARLPFTDKDELRATLSPADPIGTHLAVPLDSLARIYSTSGTTGEPSFIPLTADDLADWVRISCRTYSASGVRRGCRLVSTYNAGPFVAAITLDAFNSLGLIHIPAAAGGSERVLAAIRALKADTVALTPSYALHLAEHAAAHGIDLAASSVERLLVAGEPGGGEPVFRARLEQAWGARVTEAMGIGDIAASLWGECSAQRGMHFSGQGLVHFELIDPATGAVIPLSGAADGVEGELVYTHLRQRAAPLVRFRSRDHVRVSTGVCTCGRTAPRLRCIGRTDDMLIVRGVNVFPSAVREIVNEFRPAVSGVIAVRPKSRGVRQAPPLPVVVEAGDADAGLAARIAARLRAVLLFTADVTVVPNGSLPRSSYKSRLVDWPEI